MEDFIKPKSHIVGKMQIESMKGMRSQSASHGSMEIMRSEIKETKMKKWRSSRVGSAASRKWGLTLVNDLPELQRKKRVAGYKVYSVKANVKGSVRKGFRWVKDHVVTGWW